MPAGLLDHAVGRFDSAVGRPPVANGAKIPSRRRRRVRPSHLTCHMHEQPATPTPLGTSICTWPAVFACGTGPFGQARAAHISGLATPTNCGRRRSGCAATVAGAPRRPGGANPPRWMPDRKAGQVRVGRPGEPGSARTRPGSPGCGRRRPTGNRWGWGSTSTESAGTTTITTCAVRRYRISSRVTRILRVPRRGSTVQATGASPTPPSAVR